MKRIGIVAGEASGDFLASGLIRAIRERYPDAHFEGVAGPQMEAAGCHALYPSDTLAVMGLVEVLAHLPELLRIRRILARRWIDSPPEVFVGVDAPDFNLPLERRLRDAGIPTVHYVSPTVWAWRQGRVRTVAKSVDRILTLFPFEKEFYERHHVPARFVGHPLADEIPMRVDREPTRRELGLPVHGRIVALLPGSRLGEVEKLAEPFLKAASLVREARPGLHFVVAIAGSAVGRQVRDVAARVAADLPVTFIEGRSRDVMAAADAVLLASGTAALEAMLLNRPMVVAYRVAALTYWLLTRLRILKVSRYSLPNLLAGRDVVPELIQGDVVPEKLAAGVLALLDDPATIDRQQALFGEIHQQLRRNASARAADAVLELCE